MARLENVRHEKFCQNIVLGKTQTESYLKAGFKCTEDAARKNATTLMTKKDIIKRIDELRQKDGEKFDVTRERIMQEYARIAFLDPRKIFAEDGSLKSLDQMDEDSVRAIAGIEVEHLFEGRGEDREMTGYLKKIKISDKKGALDSLARIKGMFNDKMDITVNTHDERIKRIQDKFADIEE